MRYFLSFILFIYAVPVLYSQMINNLEGNAFTNQPFFDREFIKINKIKSIEGQYSKKRDGEVVKPTNDFFRYDFDSLGNLIKTTQIKTENSKKDTSFNFYAYDKNNLLTTHKKTELGGLTSMNYLFDSLSRICLIQQNREIIDLKGNVLQSFVINKESIKYLKTEKGIKKVTYNNYGLPYLDEFTKWNDDGYKIEETQKLRMASTEYKKKYFYSEKGLLASIQTFYNNSENPVEEFTFKYDSFGNIIEKKHFKEGIFSDELQVIYDNKTQLIGSTIERIEGSHTLLILRFTSFKYYK